MFNRRIFWGSLLVGLFFGAQIAVAQEEGASEERVWTVAVMADLNGPYGSTEYNQFVHAAVEWLRDDLQPDAVVIAGDMVAGQQGGLDYRAMWRAFHEVVTDPLMEAGIPLAVTPGNHDASGATPFWEERVEYARQWELRRLSLDFVDDRFYPFHYAFSVGPALFLSLDGTGVGPLDDRQLAWIEEILEAHQHVNVSVLMSHVPQYAVAQGREREIFNDEGLAELMKRYDVDMKISGHHHAYYPGWRDGTYFLHASALGSGVRMLIDEERRRPRNVAIVRFNEQGIIDVEARVAPDFEEVVDVENLPESIGQGDLEIFRMDQAEQMDGSS